MTGLSHLEVCLPGVACACLIHGADLISGVLVIHHVL